MIDNVAERAFMFRKGGEEEEGGGKRGNTPVGWIAEPEDGVVTYDSTVMLHTSNFYAGPNAGRVVLMVDDRYVVNLISEHTSLKLTGLDSGTHNLTMSIFLRPNSPDPYTIARTTFTYVNITEMGEESGGVANPISTTDLFFLRSNLKRKVIPILEILSPSPNHKLLYSEYGVTFLFDFLCEEGERCGQRR